MIIIQIILLLLFVYAVTISYAVHTSASFSLIGPMIEEGTELSERPDPPSVFQAAHEGATPTTPQRLLVQFRYVNNCLDCVLDLD